MLIDPIEYAWKELNSAPFPAALGGFAPNPAQFTRKPMAQPERTAAASTESKPWRADTGKRHGPAPSPPPVADGVRFREGEACPQGHTVRYVSTGGCVQCARESTRKSAAASQV